MSDFGDLYDIANNWYSGYSHTVGMAEDTRYTAAGLGANAISFGQSLARDGAQKLGDTDHRFRPENDDNHEQPDWGRGS